MKLTSLPSKTAIHCETQEEFDRIAPIVAEHAKVPQLLPEWFEIDKENTVIQIDKGTFGTVRFSKINGYIIISSTEIE